MGRPKHQTFLLDVSKQAQALVEALKAAQTQQQEIYQMVQEQVQAHLAEELSNWRAEQQIHEEIYLERITKLEQEVSKLRTELTEAQRTVQQPVTSSESHTWNRYRQYCRKGLGFYLAQVYGK
ncbi:uncharacterized protein EURHEDRAFT_382361 [Aspergillus ruber CBS 135680]|uniref:Uncharacterized protein n=1 Tax=Aspergillus ruber (strain CBS 135680) TaxID=1388766 RepID=A0A017RZK0_ASPRC|nr:uncharacterized protein EURHEDRAFT_382361 [Aspergillus ruber CBS 135680]EYE90001.1 hypothetical protein EURHEDRAFT_382361 [Aspergillus ruber CBS 135680]